MSSAGLGFISERVGADNPNCFIRVFTSLLYEKNTHNRNSSVLDNKKIIIYESVKHYTCLWRLSVKLFRYCCVNWRIDRTLDSIDVRDAPTNAGKHVTSNIACVRSQRNTKDKYFDWSNKVVEPTVISGGLTNGLSIRQY